MKVVVIEGLKPKIVEVNYKFFVDQASNYESKGKHEKAKAMRKIIERLDIESALGHEITEELIEIVVNDIIEENKQRRLELKKQIKALDSETSIVRAYSKKEQDEDIANSAVDLLLF
jgi:hypothetical protein